MLDTLSRPRWHVDICKLRSVADFPLLFLKAAAALVIALHATAVSNSLLLMIFDI